MILAENKSFDDGFRWYHGIFVWMIILPVFLIAIVPDGAWHPFIVGGFIISAITGVILILKVPPGKRKSKKRKIEG
jgi:hypothetical protein